MLVHTPICDFGWKAPNFALPDLDGKIVTFDDVRGEKGTLIAFICNHCPYVRAVIDRFAEDTDKLQEAGIGVAAIMANDFAAYPDDAPDKMRSFAEKHGFTFPYLLDESQEVARAYEAVCTPDFFGFDAQDGLQYRGRLDESKIDTVPGAKRELLEAMLEIARSGKGPAEQIASMGCSIKWRSEGLEGIR